MGRHNTLAELFTRGYLCCIGLPSQSSPGGSGQSGNTATFGMPPGFLDPGPTQAPSPAVDPVKLDLFEQQAFNGTVPAVPAFLSASGSPPPSILFIIGDPIASTCSEFIPGALPWSSGPCPWLLPGIIVSNYTMHGVQPLRYDHAKIQQDLSRTRT